MGGAVRLTALWAVLLSGAAGLAVGGCGGGVKKPAAVISMEKGGEFRIDF